MTDSTISDPIRDYILADSDRRDQEQRRLLNSWEAGWRACEAARNDPYELDPAGITRLKEERAYKDLRQIADQNKEAEQVLEQMAAEEEGPPGRWELRGEPRTRATFADPHPDDYMGGPVAPW